MCEVEVKRPRFNLDRGFFDGERPVVVSPLGAHIFIMNAFCKSCDWWGESASAHCPECGGDALRHPELFELTIAHIDCDSFYASVEKRERPEWRDKPLIVGGQDNRSVVTTACYVARQFGVRSAMPMWKAKQLCPKAIIVPPNFDLYKEVSSQIRAKYEALTPLVEPMSLDEAYLDMKGVENLHKAPAAVVLRNVAREIKRDIGVTVSVGLSFGKTFAKVASDFEKPFGFSVLGKSDIPGRIAGLDVKLIPGVGPKAQKVLHENGVDVLSDVETIGLRRLAGQVGDLAIKLNNLAQGVDKASITLPGPPKSISNETTFSKDVSSFEDLRAALWPLCEKVSSRLKEKEFRACVVTLKLKTSEFQSITRQVSVLPTQMAEDIFEAAERLLKKESGRYRLLGVGVSQLQDANVPVQSQMFDDDRSKRSAAERAMDEIRQKWGQGAIFKARGKSSSN